jgi:hypothetical protein
MNPDEAWKSLFSAADGEPNSRQGSLSFDDTYGGPAELIRLLGLWPPPAEPVGGPPTALCGRPGEPSPDAQRPRQPSWNSSSFKVDWQPYQAKDDEYDDEADEYAAEDDEDSYEEDRCEEDDEYWATEYPELPRARVRRTPRHQPKSRHAVQVVLPILVLIVVGVGAVKLLPLANRSDQTTGSPAGSTVGAPTANATGTTAFTTFAGYQGQQRRDGGELAIRSVAAAGGAQLAVGSADGYPAIWRRGPGDSWSLARGAADGVLAGRPGTETMTAATHGPAGWLAVGNVVSGAVQHPVVVTSADGTAWQAADGEPAFGMGGVYAYGAAADRFGYVIVGEHTIGNRVIAATWWSGGLGGWTPGGNGGLDGRLKPSAMFAAATGPDGFIAVGGHGTGPAVWMSKDGQQWTITNLPLPAGASDGVLRQVAAHGARVVATGSAVTATGTVPFAEVSANGGVTWREVSLPAPGRQAAVTALAASGTGFTAAGQSGQSGDPAAVMWRSADGRNWTAARPVPGPPGGKVQEIVGLAAAGSTVTGVGVAATRLGARPVVYTVVTSPTQTAPVSGLA